MTTGFVAPPRWSPHQLDAAVASAIESFRHERSAEPVEQYGDHLDEYLCTVDELMELTVDLLELPQRAMEAVSEPRLLEALRFCAGPFVSEDDLAVLAQTTLSRKRLLGDPAAAARVVDTILLGLDGRRFPWVEDAREATERERAAAVLSTAVLLATERTRTARRSTAKLDQEGEVAATLLEAGFRQVPPPASIRTLEEAPGPGEFCHEVDFGGRKADLVVGLWDRRRMPVECKVSNSSTNSYKRVNNDAAVKAVNWLQVFGRDQVVPAAVLAGVFKAGPLTEAQDNGLTLFWAHRLDDLVAWIDRTRPETAPAPPAAAGGGGLRSPARAPAASTGSSPVPSRPIASRGAPAVPQPGGGQPGAAPADGPRDAGTVTEAARQTAAEERYQATGAPGAGSRAGRWGGPCS